MSGSKRDSHAARVAATPSLTVELLAGSIAGAAQVIVGQPLDTVKTRAQIAPSEFVVTAGTGRHKSIDGLKDLYILLWFFRGDVCKFLIYEHDPS